ncbi:MAG: hypothetical protein A49_32580 [Methyloceanibacter sp.]|nr:MAG: hypothetical protein A49_32580 [Methyloceanibacter sp.]
MNSRKPRQETTCAEYWMPYAGTENPKEGSNGATGKMVGPFERETKEAEQNRTLARTNT